MVRSIIGFVSALAGIVLWQFIIFEAGVGYHEVKRYDTGERVIIDQFAAVYCNLHRATSKADADLQTAQSALVSRMSIEAGVGLLARAEYLRCAAGAE